MRIPEKFIDRYEIYPVNTLKRQNSFYTCQ